MNTFDETPEKNYLADDFKAPLKYATTGQRFINYIIDWISFVVFLLVFGFILGIGVALTTGETEIFESLEGIDPILDRLISLVLFSLYIGVVEGITGGKSPGKFLTGTRAVYEDSGERISFSTAMLRGLSRAVPIEPFSALGGHPWHDQWTDTRVVSER